MCLCVLWYADESRYANCYLYNVGFQVTMRAGMIIALVGGTIEPSKEMGKS